MPQKCTQLFVLLSPAFKLCNQGFLQVFLWLLLATVQVLSWAPQNTHRSHSKKLDSFYIVSSLQRDSL